MKCRARLELEYADRMSKITQQVRVGGQSTKDNQFYVVVVVELISVLLLM